MGQFSRVLKLNKKAADSCHTMPLFTISSKGAAEYGIWQSTNYVMALDIYFIQIFQDYGGLSTVGRLFVLCWLVLM